ncbi:Xaa-Pro peptidase family protein [Chromatiaceae bacterium AAb-1]|nr:Xaa-Pro peptidase family protein [Chromatiaceae bacterium AAb-1]
MTLGVGGVTKAEALAALTDMTGGVQPVGVQEYQERLQKAVKLMQQQGIDALLLNAGTNLAYFTGINWYASERLVAALLLANGELHYVVPHFEIGTVKPLIKTDGQLHGWHEHENPYQLCVSLLQGKQNVRFAIDESAAFFIADGLYKAAPGWQFCNGSVITAACRMQKSAAEIAIMQRAMDMTLRVHQAVAGILYEGITTEEVTAFIDEAHRRVGAPAGSYFCIVLFGPDSAFPHGVDKPKVLEKNDMVLIDTGCRLLGYVSDITRSYVFGDASERQRQIWNAEKTAQQAAFDAARIDVACQEVDRAARRSLIASGLSSGYDLPGLPHRTGHGIGMDIHEWTYLVEGNETPLAAGMCFSNEPMICVPGEFGVRLEDHFYMTDSGPQWFTAPAYSVDDPFGLR